MSIFTNIRGKNKSFEGFVPLVNTAVSLSILEKKVKNILDPKIFFQSVTYLLSSKRDEIRICYFIILSLVQNTLGVFVENT